MAAKPRRLRPMQCRIYDVPLTASRETSPKAKAPGRSAASQHASGAARGGAFGGADGGACSGGAASSASAAPSAWPGATDACGGGDASSAAWATRGGAERGRERLGATGVKEGTPLGFVIAALNAHARAMDLPFSDKLQVNASLASRVEFVTGESCPASALIRLASQLTGRDEGCSSPNNGRSTASCFASQIYSPERVVSRRSAGTASPVRKGALSAQDVTSTRGQTPSSKSQTSTLKEPLRRQVPQRSSPRRGSSRTAPLRMPMLQGPWSARHRPRCRTAQQLSGMRGRPTSSIAVSSQRPSRHSPSAASEGTVSEAVGEAEAQPVTAESRRSSAASASKLAGEGSPIDAEEAKAVLSSRGSARGCSNVDDRRPSWSAASDKHEVELEPEAAGDDEAEGVHVEAMRPVRRQNTSDHVRVCWSQEELGGIFKKFSEKDVLEVRVENLPPLLRYLGARISDSEVHMLVTAQTRYSSLDWFEFMEFIANYMKFDYKKLKHLFRQADTDGNDALDFQELHNLLTNCGYSPCVDATLEALQAIDENRDGRVDLSEFMMLRDHLRISRGFTRHASEQLQVLYVRLAGAMDQSLPVEDIWRMSAYVGYSASQSTIEDYLALVGPDSRSMSTYDAALEVIRAVRDQEKSRIMYVCHMRGRRGSIHEVGNKHNLFTEQPRTLSIPNFGGVPSASQRKIARMSMSAIAVNISEIQNILLDLEYFVSQDLIDEIIEDMQTELMMEDHIVPEELLAFTQRLRQVEGFSKAETADLRLIFEREQSEKHPGNCALNALELGRVLRWFGISRSVHQVQRLIDEIDLDKKGKVEFEEFAKLMRQLLVTDGRRRMKIFKMFDPSDAGSISRSDLKEALWRILKSEPDTEMMNDSLEQVDVQGDSMTIVDFEEVFRVYRLLLTETVRLNAGYIPSEVEQLSELFERYDKYENGIVQGSELRKLIADNIPEATQDKTSQQEILRLLDEVAGTDGLADDRTVSDMTFGKEPASSPGTPRAFGGMKSLTFTQFLWLTRRCHDRRDKRDIAVEARILQECDFGPDEVEGYRQLFSAGVNWAGELNLKAVKGLLSRIHVLTPTQEEKLGQLVRELSPERREAVRFPQFLLLMQMLEKDNFLGLKDAVERALSSSMSRAATKGLPPRAR